MKGILKIYHPDETLKYNIRQSYCKAVYLNNQHYLELELITDDGLDHVDDDSLQYRFPQLALRISDFEIDSDVLAGKVFDIDDTDEEAYTSLDLFDDDNAYLYQNNLAFSEENGELQLCWKGQCDDFYTNTEDLIDFKLKCSLREEEIVIDDD